MFTFIAYVVSLILRVTSHLGLIGFFGLMAEGKFEDMFTFWPMLIVGLVWGIITCSLNIAPRAYWAFSPLNVMGEKVGAVIYNMLGFFLAPYAIQLILLLIDKF